MIPLPSDIDPNKLNVEAKRTRRRKVRKKPDPPASLKASEQAAIERLEQMPLNPGVMLEPKGDGLTITAPHNDLELWDVQLAVAFGTRSSSLIETFVRQLKSLCPKDWDEDLGRWKTNEREWNALLAMVADHQPENASQAALAAQMASVHLMQIRLAKQALNSGGMVMEKDAALASKLARTFAMLCETMMLMKGKKVPSRQTIKVIKEVHQYVQYNDNRGGAAEETAAQPRERSEREPARIIDQRDALRGEDESGDVVPLPCRARGK